MPRRVWVAALFAVSAAAHAQEGPRIAFGGDVIYDAPLAYQLRRRAREVGRERAYAEVFSDLAPALRAADLAIVNLETPVSPRFRERGAARAAPVFSAPEPFLDALASAGVDALTVANNHAYDQGVRGLRHTLAAIERRSLAAVGAGRDAREAARAVVLDHEGARIAVAAWTEGSNHRPRAREGSSPRIASLRDGTLAESLRTARAEAYLVVAVFHWTHEDLVHPRSTMREIAREAAEAGADVVIGHGTHVPGRTEILETRDGRRVHVLYSLGNLIASMEEPAGTLQNREVGVRDAPLALVRTRWEGERLAVDRVEFVHHWIARPTSAPWLAEGRIPVSRAVSIAAELARIERAGCGPPCDERAAAYRRRAMLVERAMRPLGEDALARPSRAASIEPSGRRRNGTDDARATRARRSSGGADEAAAAHARRAAADGAGPSVPPEPRRRAAARNGRAPRPRIADRDPRLAPYLRGVRLEVSFAAGSARERAIDSAELARIAALLREDLGLRCEVVAVAPDAVLARLRARRVQGLIAIRGPSRSRFVAHGRAGSEEGVTIRLARDGGRALEQRTEGTGRPLDDRTRARAVAGDLPGRSVQRGSF